MMKFIRVLPLAVLLAACGITNPFTGQAVTAADVSAAAVAACGFLPTVQTVETMLNANSTVQTAQAIAQAICSLATAKAGKLGGAPMAPGMIIPVGFVVHGKFVR